jgi:hypothetical protein
MNKYIAIIIFLLTMGIGEMEGRGQVPISEIRGNNELIYGVENVIKFEVVDIELFNGIDIWLEMGNGLQVKVVNVYSYIFEHNDNTILFAGDRFSNTFTKSIEFVVVPTDFAPGTILMREGYLYRGDSWEQLYANPFKYSVVIPEPQYWGLLLAGLGWGFLYRYKKLSQQ